MNSPDPIDHVFVRGLRVQAIIGIHEHERSLKQAVCFDIEASTDARRARAHDHIDSGVTNYARMREIAITAAAEEFQLVESLAECVAQRILAEPGVRFVTVQVTKPDAFQDAEAVGVCIRREAANATRQG